MKRRRKREDAFGLVELTVVLGAVVIIFLLLFAFLTQSRVRSGGIQCVNNLKHLGLAARIFASANTNLYPGELLSGTNAAVLDAAGYFRMMQGEIGTPKILVCPDDQKRTWTNNFAALGPRNISYFANLAASATNPAAFLYGDDHLQLGTNRITSGLLTISSNSPMSWTPERHNGGGNIAMADGSVHQFDTPLLQKHLPSSGISSNVLVFP